MDGLSAGGCTIGRGNGKCHKHQRWKEKWPIFAGLK
jgi:hypothetical protein